MNKEEILKKSREENGNMDEREREVLVKAGNVARLVGGAVCSLILLLEAIFADYPNPGVWAVYLSMSGTTLLIKYAYLKKKHELVFGVAHLVVALACFVVYVLLLLR